MAQVTRLEFSRNGWDYSLSWETYRDPPTWSFTASRIGGNPKTISADLEASPDDTQAAISEAVGVVIDAEIMDFI